MPSKLYIKTFGCQMNEYDAGKMADLLHAADGMIATSTPDDADVIIFNTCSVREKAQEKVFHDLGRIKHLKQARPGLIIGVGGCVASQEGGAIVARAPYVDLVFGPQTLHRLPAMLAARRASGAPQVDISFPEIEKFDCLPPARVTGGSAFVSVMEGCSKYCSFCVVPYTRGEEFSRPLDDVLTEVAELAEQGVKELTLLGQNVNAYRVAIRESGVAIREPGVAIREPGVAIRESGTTIREPGVAIRESGGNVATCGSVDLALLLEYIAEIPGIERLRYTTSHPKEFTRRLVDVYARLPQLAGHVHLPVQSGSDRVLAAMKRGYTALEYKSIVRNLRKVRPGISISSDFIVGFPGETAADFAATLELVEEVCFDASYSFVYSPRPGTPAAELPDATPHQTKLARLHELQALLDARAQAISEAMIGTTQRVLVEGVSKKNARELAARTDNNRIVNFAGRARLTGQFVEVTITAALAHTLRGELALVHA